MKQFPSPLLTYNTMPALSQLHFPAAPINQVVKPPRIVSNKWLVFAGSSGGFNGISTAQVQVPGLELLRYISFKVPTSIRLKSRCLSFS